MLSDHCSVNKIPEKYNFHEKLIDLCGHAVQLFAKLLSQAVTEWWFSTYLANYPGQTKISKQISRIEQILISFQSDIEKIFNSLVNLTAEVMYTRSKFVLRTETKHIGVFNVTSQDSFYVFIFFVIVEYFSILIFDIIHDLYLLSPTN